VDSIRRNATGAKKPLTAANLRDGVSLGFLLIHRAIEWIQTFSVLYVPLRFTNGKVGVE
jgi:hypothetical protein